MKTLFRQGLLLLVLFVAISNSLEPPDLVEELDGMLDSPYTKYTSNKASDEGDDTMSDDTSSNPDDDKEMMETADTSDHEEDDGMGGDVNDEDKKTVEKSKIQHNSSHSKTEKGNKNDELESKDNDGNDDAENEDKLENLPQDGLKDKVIGAEKANKEEEDEKGNDHEVEQPREDGTKSDTEDLSEAEGVSVSKGNNKQKDVSPIKPDAAKDVESVSSDGKASINNESKAENGAKTDEDTDNEKNDESRITVKNTNNKDTETLKPGSSDDSSVDRDNEKLKPKASGTTEIVKSTSKDNLDGDQTTKLKAGKNYHDKEQKSHGNNRNEINEHDDDNNSNSNNNDNSGNDKTNDDSDAKKTEEPKKSSKDEYEEHKSPTQADNNTNEDNHHTKVESTTENEDNDKPELSTNDEVENDGNENLKSEQNEKNKDINQLTHTTDDNTGNTATGKLKLTTGENVVSKNTDKTNGVTKTDTNRNEDNNNLPQTTNDKLAKANIDKTKLEKKGSNDKSTNTDDKSDITLSAANENDLDSTKLATDNPKNDKASHTGSDVKDKNKNKQHNNGQYPSEGSIDLVKDNEGSNPIHFDPRLKDENNQDGRKDNKNSNEVNDMEKDKPNKKSNKDNEDDKADSSVHDGDIQRKVEQLSMKTGDESEEEGEKLVITEENGDRPNTVAAEDKQETRKVATNRNSGGDNDDNEGENSSPSQETKSSSQQEQLQDNTSRDLTETTQNMNKVDVVNTLVGSSSNNEKAVSSSVSAVNVQASGDNVQENVVDQTEEKDTKDGKGNVEGLLHDLVPSGILPNLPEGFAKLSEMSTVSFTYNVHENNDVTVTSDIKQPMELFHGKLEISNANLEFAYNDKEKQGQKWQFKAEGTWVNGEQEVDVILESSKHDDHFTLTGKGDSLALHDYSSMFAKQETFSKSGMNMHVFEEIMLSDIELYVVFKDFENIVSLVSGDVKVGHGTHASRCQTFIEKFPEKEPVFSILLDFLEGSPLTVLTSVMADKIASNPYIKELLDGKGLLKVTEGGFGFAASSAEVKKLRLNVFGEGMLERELGSHISSGVTLTLPVSFHSQNAVETHDIIAKISRDAISFFPTKDSAVDLTKVFKTLSEFTRPKISSLGYPDVGNLFLRELRYDVGKTVYTVLGYSTGQFNLAPGMIYLDDANLEFRQYVPNEFATLALFGSGRTNIGQARVNVTLHTDTDANELLINGEAHTIWSPDIASTFGVAMEINDDVTRILNDNRMLNMNIENARMFATVKDGESGLVHFSGHSRPISWNDAIQVEAVVFHDNLTNKKRMTTGYLFDKLPLTYAIDAFSFNQFPTPRLLDNSRNTTLVLSPVNTESLFLNPAFSGLSFMRGLSLVGQFRLPDVCSLNTLCESAVQLLGTEKWYRVQGLVSSHGYTLAGYVDKEFNLAKGLKLSDNILEFTLGNYSYMSISTAMRLDKDNLSFTGYINFDPNGVRLRMTSNDVWKHPFPGKFITFDRLQIDVPLISGIAMDELLATGELNFGLPGSLYRIFAPAYLTFTPSKPKQVGFQATMANITLETITSALNFKSSLPGVLLNSRFPDTLVARYTPNNKDDEDLELYGKLDILSRTLICKLRIDKTKHITATTSHSKFPLILDDGLITVYADQHQPRLGPRAWFTITPESTKFKLKGFANFMGLGTKTKIDVSESGTEFSLTGNLFDVTKTVVSFMSPDGLPENGPYFASACLPSIIPHVTSQVNLLLAAAADQAERYMKQASANYNQAAVYHKQALADERKQILMVDEGENDIENDDREMFLAEERYNKTCREEQCGKTCIGCTSWLKCCDRDVFGNCVKCPGWKACCWHGKSPICKAKNHACRIIKQIAAENLQKIARRVYADKEKKRAKEKVLWNSEFMKGKTQAVLDAARRALHLVNHDSRVGLGAAESIKRFGLERLVNIKSVCFHTTLKTLATSCVTMRINLTFANEDEMQSLPYYGCLNRELVSKMANHIAHFMFRDRENDKVPTKQAESKPKPGRRRGGRLFGKPLEEEQVDLTTAPPGNTYIMRKRRYYDAADDDMESRPFWLIRNNYQPHVPSFLQQRTTVPRTPLKKKWQIPASKKGKCKVYRQLVEICKDMMATVKKMFESYEDGKEKYHKRLTELQLGLNTTIYDLEKQVMDSSELLDRLPDIEMNIRTVGTGVNQWKLNCEADQEDQNKIAIQEWVSTMEGRIRKLGGQGVDRFLSNLFRAFEGMFLGAETPKHSAQKVLNTLQAIREISATFHDIFGNNEITLEKANSRAEIVITKLKQIKDAQMFCDD